MQRELTTIGSLRTMRGIERSSRLLSLRGMGWIGQTNTAYVAPSPQQIDTEPPGDALTAATLAMLEHFQTAGVPSEHTSDPFVLSFEQTYNKDPASWASATMKLGEDGGYGPNVHDAAAALVLYTGGGPVPAVNSGPSPVTPSTVIVTKPSSSTSTTTTTTTTTGLSTGAKWLLGIAVALGLGWGASRVLKKRRARRRAARPSTAIVLAP